MTAPGLVPSAPLVPPIRSAIQRPSRAQDSARSTSLDAVFRPRSVAVIGASRDRGTIGAALVRNLVEGGFQGPVYPVNPHAKVVHSVVAYPSVLDVPGDVDLAIIVVPAAAVLASLDECGRKGVKAAVIISAGFKEIGPEGLAREQSVVECARRHGLRLIGPNCLGVMNTNPGVLMNATFSPTFPPAGRVAFSSQSGALGFVILEHAAELNLGISQFASVGNKADVSGSDLLEYWEHDPDVSVILLYLESFGNPRRFIPIARRVARRKPVIAVKSGRTAAGVRAAASHTGALAGADATVDALCRQTGIIRTDTIEELFDVAMLLAHQPVPRGRRVGIVTNAGGPGIMASDACESHGLEIPALEDATSHALRAFLPVEASTRNPVDMIASARPESYEWAVRLVLDDPNVDALLAIYVPPVVTRPLDIAQAIARGVRAAHEDARARGQAPKPVVTCFMGSHGIPEGLQSLQEGHIPSFAFPEPAAIALARASAYGRWLETPEGSVPDLENIRSEGARRVIDLATQRARDRRAWLTPGECRALLQAYGIGMAEPRFAGTAATAAEAAARIGAPVAVKLASRTISHKTEMGGVVLDVRTPAEAERAYESITQRLRAAGREAEMDGVVVQPMVQDGVEVIIGMTQVPSFGPVLMFGLGGVAVELLQDVALRIHPLTDRDAQEMVRSVRGFRMLEGWRGAPPGDIAAVEQTLLRVSRLVADFPEIVEMDLNPVKVLTPGHGCVVVDARIAVRKR